jgi:choline dehydrogenase-like flavoprotein
MHVDARTLPDGTQIEGDICIIGAGAAGISLAKEWGGRNEKIILLEGGGFSIDAAVQNLNHGENIGQNYFTLQSARLRFFGGTTGHWAGFCSTLDNIDFEKREWVPLSGWPFGLNELDPFYSRAHKILELGPYNYDVEFWKNNEKNYVELPLDENKLRTKMWQFSPPTRFGSVYRDDIVDSENVTLYSYANVCNIEANEAVNNIDSVQIKTHQGRNLEVSAKYYVLACGAIQAARLLLASNSRSDNGLGNDRDRVGRCFMEHPEVNTGYLALPSPFPMHLYLQTIFVTKQRGEITLTEENQKNEKLLNCSISLTPNRSNQEAEAWINIFPDEAQVTLELWQEIERQFEAGEIPHPDPTDHTEYLLFTRSEQQPNPASRVVLSREKDALGVPRANLNWQLTELDKRSIRKTYEILAQEVGRVGLGRVKLMDWLYEDDNEWPSILGGGWHHMGTTRMSTSPNDGVVDENCRVHGISNLFVAGSATFPTSGVANPTLTLVAMTLRLSDHLKTII